VQKNDVADDPLLSTVNRVGRWDKVEAEQFTSPSMFHCYCYMVVYIGKDIRSTIAVSNWRLNYIEVDYLVRNKKAVAVK
jgi:hypothetical protein